MAPKPKPTKQPKTKKNHKRGICPQCGYIWQTTPEHYQHCQKELDQIAFIKPKTDKQMREYACDELCRLITIWRDGCTCVINNSKCGQVSQWGHVIPQNSSSILVYELSNSFRQCDKHNILHRFVQAPYYDWYKATWGNLAYKMLVHEWESNVGNHLNAEDLHNRLIELSDLYDMRYSFGSASLEDKVEAGFYGSIIRDAWIKEGKI
jgi:hypothetical protein